jgi:hypothetical protein
MKFYIGLVPLSLLQPSDTNNPTIVTFLCCFLIQEFIQVCADGLDVTGLTLASRVACLANRLNFLEQYASVIHYHTPIVPTNLFSAFSATCAISKVS